MRELKILATSKNILSHTWSLQPPVSLPPIWPPFSTLGFVDLPTVVFHKFNRNWAGEIWLNSIVRNTDENVAWQRWPNGRTKVAKWAEGRQEAAVTKCVKEFFSK